MKLVLRAATVLGLCVLLGGGRAAASEDSDTDSAKRHYRAGSELFAAGRYVDALREFQRAFAAKPLAALHFNIAKCYDRLSQKAEAVEAYQRYLAAGPITQDIPAVERRIAELREAELADADPETRHARLEYATGTAFFEAGKYQEALEQFQRALLVKPLPAFYVNVAKCYERLERYREAVEAYEAYLTGVPQAPDAGDVRARIEQLRIRMERRTAEEPKTEPRQPVAKKTPAARDLAPLELGPESPAPASRPRNRWLWPAVGVGAAVLVIGAVSWGVLAASATDYDAVARSRCTGSCILIDGSK